MGWHTNYDANAYQVLFTWSETGEGFFEYYDKQKDEIVKIEDVLVGNADTTTLVQGTNRIYIVGTLRTRSVNASHLHTSS